MRIGVDASRANTLERTGVEWYAYHVLRALAALPESGRHDWITYAPTPLRSDLKLGLAGWTERRLTWPPRYLWTQMRLSFEMGQFPPDVLFVPAHALPRLLPKKTVVTVHDVGFRRFPELYRSHEVAFQEIYMRDIASSNALLLTVSEFSKQEIQELYHVSSDRIVVTPLAIDTTYTPCSVEEQRRVRAAYDLGETPFFLFIGRLDQKKNMHRYVEAFLSYAEDHEHVQCALAGIPGYRWSDTEKLIQYHPQGHRVRVLGYVAEADKPALLSAAFCYVQPSLYEGFGVPVLEAMACGTLVVSSSTGSLPEVGGDAVAVYVDPLSSASIAAGLERVSAFSDGEREDFRVRGMQHATRFSWKQTAEKTLSAIELYG